MWCLGLTGTVVVSCTTAGKYHDIALATGQYHIYIALAVALIYVIGGIRYS